MRQVDCEFPYCYWVNPPCCLIGSYNGKVTIDMVYSLVLHLKLVVLKIHNGLFQINIIWMRFSLQTKKTPKHAVKRSIKFNTSCNILLNFFLNFCGIQVLFVGPLIPLFWTSGDICPGFHWYPCFGLLVTSALGFTDTPVLDFWWHLPWVSKPGWINSLSCLLTDSSDSPLVWHLLTV